MTIHNTTKLKVFFSRGMDDLNSEEVDAHETKVSNALASIGMFIINPFKTNDARRNRISGITEIIDEDIRMLEDSDIVLADLSIAGRSYVGAIFEIAHAYKLGKQIIVWVGDSGNEKRIWLKYYATAICKKFDDIVNILYLTFTDEGKKKNECEVITYYSYIAGKYEEKDSSLAKTEPETIEKYNNELLTLIQWVKNLSLGGTIIDLGSGIGRFVPIWSKNASRVVCIDASDEMLKISCQNNNSPNVEHIQGNFLDVEWLEYFLKSLGEVNVIVLGFVMNLLTLEQEKFILSFLCHIACRGTRLILLENQSSIFSTSGHFSRTEIQQRVVHNNSKIFRIYKRNFLPQDACRLLKSFGDVEKLFYTDNYFVGGVACAR